MDLHDLYADASNTSVRFQRELDVARACVAELERFAKEHAPSAYEVWKSEQANTATRGD
jgi:hypothetical protein